jgi:hypothetical protein
MASSGGASLPASFMASRSAESWMGVSGFLISCARRRATSPQACARWAEAMSVMSSKTSRCAPPGSTAPRRIRLMGCCAVPPAAPCSSKGCCQWPAGRISGALGAFGASEASCSACKASN